MSCQHYEFVRRAAKVEALMRAIPRPRRPQDRDKIAAYLEGFGPLQWRELARQAGCHEPSAQTVAAVLLAVRTQRMPEIVETTGMEMANV